MKLSVMLAARATLLVAAFAVSKVQAYTNPIVIKGYKMFDAKTGEYFAAKGIDYYPRPNDGELDVNNHDFFTDDQEAIWSKDIEYLAATGANAVRLYAVDPSKSHDQFMCALRAKGMYALIDLAASCEDCAITKDEFPACYPAALKTRGEQIILAFAKYDNVLAFSAGNEINHVVEDANTNAPCQKKFIRDMRAFIGECPSLRQIPVGVVLADPNDPKNNRELNAKYYNCRSNSSDEYENAEWYGLNAYQYCDAAVTQAAGAAGFQDMLSDFTSYSMSIPVMLTEFGCLDASFPKVDGYEAQRTWLQAGWLHSEDFRDVFSGGFVFEYSTENANSKSSSSYPFTAYGVQNYGLGYFSPKECDHSTVPCVYNPMPNYDSLAEQYNATSYLSEVVMDAFSPVAGRSTVPACPEDFTALAKITWLADSTTSWECPTALQAYTCAGQVSSGTWASGSGSGTTGTPAPTTTASTGAGSSSSATTTTTNAATQTSTFQDSLWVSVVSATLVSTLAVAFY